MNYSRSRTYAKKRSRRGFRFRYLIVLNIALLALIAAAVVWLLQNGLSDGDRQTSPGASEAAIATPHTTASPSHAAPVSEPAGDDNPGEVPSGDASGKVKLAFVGDILPAASVARLMEKFGYDYPFRKAAELLKSADITAGNLESPITDRGTPEENKQYLFRGPAEALPAIKDAGFDVLSLANNHTLDFGWVGLQDTMEALDDQGLRHMGAGSDDKEAFTPVYIESNGLTVAYIGVTRVVPEVSWKADGNNPGVAEAYNHTRAVAAIKDARINADLVVVMVHWGIEKADQPSPHQTDLGRRFIDAGADLVVGSHPHVLQGFESYKDKWIAYSLGNFVFNMTATAKTADTGVLVAECGKDGGCDLQLHPMRAVNSQPAPMDEETGKALLARLSAVSTAAVVEENGSLVAKR